MGELEFMEYKKCEHCGEQIHIRSKKCPFCNQTVAEVPEEVITDEVKNDNENVIEKQEDSVSNSSPFEEKANPSSELENDIINQPKINFEIGADGKPKDYVYKAEVRHSLEYTNPMSNFSKVFISALCTLPVIGQFVGVLLGVFFSTYDDSDKRSFGKALIYLSICMFFIYLLYVKYAIGLLGDIDVNTLLQN